MLKINNKSISSVYDETTSIGKIMKGTLLVYEAFKKLIASGVPPITLQKCKGVDLVDYKIYGNSVQQLLPNEYQQVEYIESTGTECIDSGVETSDDVGMYADFHIDEASMIMGSRGSDNVDDRFWINPSSTLYYGWNISNALEINCLNNRNVVELNLYNSRKVVASNNTVETPMTATLNETLATTNTAKIGLFGNLFNSGAFRGRISKIYRAKITKGNDLVRDFIPCYRKSDNVMGMYDLITGTFYTNKRTGTFLKGNNAPTPDTPIEVESVGDKTKNIMPINNDCSATMRGLSLTIENDVLTLDGTLSTNIQFGLYLDNGKLNIHTKGVIGIENDTPNLMILNAGTYITSFKYLGGTYERENESINAGYYGLYTYKNGVKLLDDRNAIRMSDYSSKLTLTEETEAQFFVIQFTANNNPITFNNYQFKIQIENGSTATEYEPYGYKIPVKVRSKNIFNADTLTQFDKQADGSYLSNKQIHISQHIMEDLKGVYTISAKIKSPIGKNYRLIAMYTDGTSTDSWKDSIGEYLDYKLTTNGKDIDYIAFKYSVLSDEVQFKNLQIEKGEAQTEYEPYVEPVTTNIYLNEPLRKIGDYADYIDFENQKVFRNVGQEVYDGNTSFNLSTSTYFYEEGVTTAFVKTIPTNALPNSLGMTCLTNLFEHRKANSLDKTKPYISGNIGQNIIVVKNETATTVEELKAFLADNNMEIIYPLAKETPEDITLPNIPTNKGTNIIEVDTNILPSNMEVKYYGKTNILLLNEEENIILNSIINDNTETEKDITDTEIIQILDEIIGG